VGVLALQGDVREHLRALSRCGAQVRPVRRPDDLAGLDGIVLPGGESTTIDKLARLFGLREPLVAALRSGLPAYGSCAGMIMLADELLDGSPGQETFGGLDIVLRRNAFGRQTESFEVDLPLSGVAEVVHAVFIRAPWVERVGQDVEVLATIAPQPDTPGRIVAVRQGLLFATSFHPEVTDDLRVHRYFLDLVRDARA
jgi:5'-phosphate synthase pdxT subunit